MERIAVRLPNPVGDVVAATPLLEILRRQNPEARLLAVGDERAAEVLAGFDPIDEFEVMDSRERRGWLGPRREAIRLRRLMVNRILLLPNSFSSAYAAWLAGIPERIGRQAWGRTWLLSDSLPPISEDGPRPMTQVYSELVGEVKPPAISLATTVREETLAQETLEGLAKHNIHPPFLGVAPGAAFGPSKICPPGLLAEAVRLAVAKTDLQAVYFGAPSEMDLVRRVKDSFPAPFLHASLGEMKALLPHCRALLTMDSGARHLAAALCVPQVVLYGPTDPRWTEFERELTVPLRQEKVPCSPCHKKICPIDHRCLASMEPESIAAAVSKACQLGSILSFGDTAVESAPEKAR